MENLEPKKERSPIESLRFQRKSDYKKFRNFIKKETEELKGIKEPKQDKLKSILKVGVGGLGLLSIGVSALTGERNNFLIRACGGILAAITWKPKFIMLSLLVLIEIVAVLLVFLHRPDLNKRFIKDYFWNV